MAKFVYRMQNILEIKYKTETQAKSHYSNMQARFNEEQDKLEQMFARKKELEDYHRELAVGNLDVKELLVEVKVAQKNLEMARIRLNENMKDRKTHEKLRENAFEEFLLELSAQEKKEIDELVSYRYGQAEEE